jgi:hypothetical protein
VPCRLLLHCVVAVRDGGRALQGDRGGQVGEMGEALREVAEQLAVLRVDLFGEQAQVVGGCDGARGPGAGLVEPALAGEAFGEPERTGQEGPLATGKPVVGEVAADQPVAAKLGGDRVGGAQHARIAPVHKPQGGEL